MNARTAGLAVFCILAVAALAGATAAGWRQGRKYLAAARANAAGGSAGRTAAELRDLADESRRLAAVLDAALARNQETVAGLERQRLPPDAAAARRFTLAVLDLAARCGFAVDDVCPLDAAGRPLPAGPADPPPAAGPGAGPSFLKFFPGGAAPPPALLQLRGRGQFPALCRFLRRLADLPWTAAPVLFEIGRTGPAAPADGFGSGALEEPPGAAASAPADGPLSLTVVLAR